MIAFLLLATLQSSSSRPDAAVVGTVRDAESGRPLVGAIVTALDAGRWATANSDGRYAIAMLPAGPQRIALRSLGHAPYSLRVIVPRDGTLELNVALQAIPTRLPIVEVRRHRGVIDQSTRMAPTTDQRTITAAQLASHPQLSEPDFLRAVTGGDVGMAPETPGGLHVRGGGADQTEFAIDGAPVFNPFHVSDLLGALDAWADKGTAPGTLEASKIVAGANAFSRPLCQFPRYPRYTGPSNDAEAAKLASNYTCTSP